jgi:hypothetical protein
VLAADFWVKILLWSIYAMNPFIRRELKEYKEEFFLFSVLKKSFVLIINCLSDVEVKNKQ